MSLNGQLRSSGLICDSDLNGNKSSADWAFSRSISNWKVTVGAVGSIDTGCTCPLCSLTLECEEEVDWRKARFLWQILFQFLTYAVRDRFPHVSVNGQQSKAHWIRPPRWSSSSSHFFVTIHLRGDESETWNQSLRSPPLSMDNQSPVALLQRSMTRWINFIMGRLRYLVLQGCQPFTDNRSDLSLSSTTTSQHHCGERKENRICEEAPSTKSSLVVLIYDFPSTHLLCVVNYIFIMLCKSADEY